MWTERAEATLPSSPDLEQLEEALDTLEQRIASFRGHPGTELAGAEPGLSGDSRAAWEAAEQDVDEASATFHEVTRLVNDAERRAAETDSTPTLGQTAAGVHPLPLVRGAIDAVDRAIVLAVRIEAARERLLPRARRAEAEAAGAGEEEAATRAGDLAERISRDPLAEHERDLQAVEQQAVSAGLRTARGRLARLSDHGREAADASDHTADRIADFASTGPALRTELDRLARWLGRIEGAGRADTNGSSGQELAAWRSAASDLDSRARAALREAQGQIAHRNRLRRDYDALNERAIRLGRREEPEIDALFQALKARLWTNQCDLGTAEDMLATLVKLLDEPPQGGAK